MVGELGLVLVSPVGVCCDLQVHQDRLRRLRTLLQFFYFMLRPPLGSY